MSEQKMNLLCIIFGHDDKKFIVHGKESFFQTLGMIRVRICNRCDRWESVKYPMVSKN